MVTRMTTAAGHPAEGEVSSPARTALRVLATAMLEDLDALADRLTLMVMRAEPCYAELGVSAPDALRENLGGTSNAASSHWASSCRPGSTRTTPPGRPAANVPGRACLWRRSSTPTAWAAR